MTTDFALAAPSRVVAVLVVHDSTQLAALSGLLGKEGLVVRSFTDTASALEAMGQATPPALIVTDVCMPGTDSWSFCRLLRSPGYAPFNRVPILVVSDARVVEEAARVTADMGACAFLAAPVDEREFAARVRQLLQSDVPVEMSRALAVEDDGGMAGLLREGFAAFMSHLPAAAFIKDAAGRTLYANEYLQALFGSRAWRGKTARELIEGEVGQRIIEDDRRALAQGPLTTEETIVDGHGAVHIYKTIRFPIPVEGGPPLLGGVAVDITERKQAEAALRASEEKHRRLFETITQGIVYQAPDGSILAANVAAQRILGLTLDQLTGKTSLDPAWRSIRQDGTELPGTEHPSMVALRTGQPVGPSIMGVFQPIRNAYAWLSVTAIPIFLPGETAPFQVYTTFDDVTERKLAEETLRRERLLVETLLASLPGIFYLYSYPELCLVRWNKSHETLLGYSAEEMRNRSIFAWHPPENRELVRQAVEVVMEKGQDAIESPLLAKDGRPVWFLMTGVRLQVENRRFLLGVGLDISERKQAEAALRESEERWRTVIENEPECVKLLDREGRVLEMNPAGLAMLEASSSQVLGQKAVGLVVEEDQAAFNEMIEAVFRGETRHLEFGMIGLKGRRLALETTSVPLADTNQSGEVKALLGVARDVTARKRAEEERERLRSQLTQAQKMESVGRLAGGVAHDFNNMLAAILGNVALALQELPLGSLVREHLEEIEKCAHRSASLTQQLLAFARKQTVTPKVLDLNATVAGMLKMLRRLIGEDIELVWAPAPELWPVKIDPGQVDQLLANLCVNARDAIRDLGKITLETRNVTLNAASAASHPGFVAGDYVLLTVSDTGCGIDKSIREHLFEPFFTTKEAGQGTGLGLATVYGIVRQNNGFIEVDSAPAQGAAFKIYLPRHADQTPPPRATVPSPAVSRGRETILLVEDEPSLLRVGKRALEGLGYTVLAALTPSEALCLAQEYRGRIDLLMTDIIMPEMNGRELAKRLLSLYPGLKRLFMSGYTADVIAHHGVLDEGIHFLQKPFTATALAEKVQAVLQAE